MPQIAIDTLDDPRLEPYRNLKHTNSTAREGLFVTEGPRVTERLLSSNCRVHSVLASQKMLRKIVEHVPDDVPLFVVSPDLAEQLVGFDFHVGVLGCGYRRENPEWSSFLPPKSEPALLIACDGITERDNVATILRIAAAFGVDGVLLGRGTADHLSRRGIRVSMGYALHLPVRRCDDLPSDLCRLSQAEGVCVAGAVLDENAEPLHTVTPPRRTCLVMGNEGRGIRTPVREACNRLWTIPMADAVDSLNVSLAAGIFLHRLRFPD